MSAPHIADDVLARWTTTSLATVTSDGPPGAVATIGGVDEATALAVEDHLDRCSRCREAVSAQVGAQAAARIEDSWWAIAAELDAPPVSRTERVLRRMRVPADVARLLVATPALRRAWFVALGVALLFGLMAASPQRAEPSELLFLVLAPLIPVAGVALAYGPGVDPAHEVTVATPISGLRLVLVRACAVLSVSVVATWFASLSLVEVSPRAAAWLVPSLALSAVCLAATSWLAPRLAGTLTAVGWIVAVSVIDAVAGETFTAFSAPAQLLWAVVGAVGALVVVLRRRAYDVVEGAP